MLGCLSRQPKESKMYIGKDGEHAPVSPAIEREASDASWMLILWPKSKSPVQNISGLICVLKNLSAICKVLGDTEDCVRRKMLHLGHYGEPALLKTGTKEEMRQVGRSLSWFVCGCHFELVVTPVI